MASSSTATPPVPMLTPSSAGAASAADGGAAALCVLTNAPLLRLIAGWSRGWPTLVAQRWRDFDEAAREFKQDQFTAASAADPNAFVNELLRRGDLETLRLAVQCTFRSAATEGREKKIKIRDVEFAIRSGDAETVKWAFQQKKKKPLASDTVRRYWGEALLYNPRNCRLWDELWAGARPTNDMLSRHRPTIDTAEVARWFASHCGSAFLSPRLLGQAAHAGNLRLVEYLLTIPSQDVENAVALAPHCHRKVEILLSAVAA